MIVVLYTTMIGHLKTLQLTNQQQSYPKRTCTEKLKNNCHKLKLIIMIHPLARRFSFRGHMLATKFGTWQYIHMYSVPQCIYGKLIGPHTLLIAHNGLRHVYNRSGLSYLNVYVHTGFNVLRKQELNIMHAYPQHMQQYNKYYNEDERLVTCIASYHTQPKRL